MGWRIQELEGAAAGVDLGHVVVAGGAVVNFRIHKAGLEQDLWQISAELGEDGVAPVAAGVADEGAPEGDGLAVGVEGGARGGLLDAWFQRDGEQVPAAGLEDAVDLGESTGQVGDVFEGFAGEDEVECGVGVGEGHEVFVREAGVEGGGGFGVVEVGGAEAGEGGDRLVEALDAVDLGDLESAGLGGMGPTL